MISYTRDPQQTIPTSAVKIIGLGGAGANMLERIALDGMEGAELLALNTDLRTLAACLAREKIQLGVNLTKGLGAGGDPELGHQAMLESEEAFRSSIKGRRIVFLCTGLGGGTGSGAAPIVTRIAREEGAFVVVFATMPFAFEGRRRREQAETALNELAVLSNALVTFDNNRMGELVLAKQGIHEAFAAADHMICESIKAVIRLVIRPGLINVGLDDLMSALRTNRSRCLFGSGIAEGKDRATKALRNALHSPLLDQGTLLKDAQTVLVHLSGGEGLTLFEIELLMQRLQKFVPEKAHILFGAAIDPAMGDSLSITLISALPEDSLAMAPRDSISHRSKENPILDPSQGFTPPPPQSASVDEAPPKEATTGIDAQPGIIVEPPAAIEPPREIKSVSPLSKFHLAEPNSVVAATPSFFNEERPFAEPDYPIKENGELAPTADLDAFTFADADHDPETIMVEDSMQEEPYVEPEPAQEDVFDTYAVADEPDPEPIESAEPEPRAKASFIPIPKRRSPLTVTWGRSKPKSAAAFPADASSGVSEDVFENDLEPAETEAPDPSSAFAITSSNSELPKLKLGPKQSGNQSELPLDSSHRGRFEGESPNVFNGEDLDLPPFLRKKK